MYNNYYSKKVHKAVNSRKILENMEEGGEEKKRGKGTQRLHFLAFCGKLQPCWLLQTLNNFCYNEKCHHKLPDKNEEKRNSYSFPFHLYTGPTVVFTWCQRVNSLTESLIAIVEKHAVILARGLFPCSLRKHNTQIVILTLSIGTTLTRLLHSRGVKIRFITCSHPSSFWLRINDYGLRISRWSGEGIS